ncbi:MAG: helix-turn-helix domain-containing protein [Planctomycetes bacterium]|nr:helix-turn-helix domain-containing protein [Planctomycetota bacterium]
MKRCPILPRPDQGPAPPDMMLKRLTKMESQVANLCGYFPTVLQKLDALRDMLGGTRTRNLLVEEVARLTGRSGFTIRRWIAEGKLKAVRIAEGGPRGRLLVPSTELDRLIACGRGPDAILVQEGV